MNTKYVCSGIILFLAGSAMISVGYLIRDMEWGKYGWAMILGVLLLGGSFLLFLYSLIRKMDYQSLRNERAEKAEKRNTEKESA
ncbi:MAG: hypothetical protein ACKOW2_01225 [Sphingobacteriaceae bacterium]